MTELNTAWERLVQKKVNGYEIKNLFRAAWRDLRDQKEREGINPFSEPDPVTGEITKVDLLRWAVDQPNTFLGRAAQLTWLEDNASHYSDVLISLVPDQSTTVTPSRTLSQKELNKIMTARSRLPALKAAIQFLSRPKQLTMDQRSAQYAPQAQAIIEKRLAQAERNKKRLDDHRKNMAEMFPHLISK